MATRIQLANNRGVVLVDDHDAEHLRQFSWRRTRRYASAWMTVNGVRKTVSMHRYLMNAQPGMEVDHINGDGLDNRRENLRFVTTHQNRANVSCGANSRSGYKGVSWFRSGKYWRARISIHNRGITIGYFKTPEDAARAYDERCRQEFGPFGRYNFPRPGEQPARIRKRAS